MMEFITTYSSEIITIASILIAITPSIIKRTISDKKLIQKFGDVSAWAKNLNTKELNINQTLNALNGLQNRIEAEVKAEIENVKNAVNEFKEDETYQKILDGLSKLNDLQEIIKEKDNLIESYQTELKLVNKRLTKLERS